MNIKKKKQTHRYREQTCGNQWKKGRGRGKDKDKELGGTSSYI